MVLLALMIVAGGITIFLNKASYDPNFSVMDAISGATKKRHRDDNKSETVSVWAYTKDDVALAGGDYTEDVIITGESAYRVLKNISLMEHKSDITLLSNKENAEYQKAVRDLAVYLEEQGNHVQIKEYSETMMLSLVHAGHFDIFLMSEEAEP